MTARLIYGFDPLCGWCYGFAPALRELRRALPDLAIDLRMGGLVTDERIRPYKEMAGYIAQASSRLAAVTDVALGEAFHARILKDPNVIASSVPPCDALLQVRGTAPGRVLDLAEALQTAHFRDGMDLNDLRTYAAVAQEAGLDVTIDLPAPDAVRAPLAKEFAESRALGLTSYPSLLIDAGGRLRALNPSYDPQTLLAEITTALAAR